MALGTADQQITRIAGLMRGGLDEDLGQNAIRALTGPHAAEIQDLFEKLSDIQVVLLLRVFGKHPVVTEFVGAGVPD